MLSCHVVSLVSLSFLKERLMPHVCTCGYLALDGVAPHPIARRQVRRHPSPRPVHRPRRCGPPTARSDGYLCTRPLLPDPGACTPGRVMKHTRRKSRVFHKESYACSEMLKISDKLTPLPGRSSREVRQRYRETGTQTGVCTHVCTRSACGLGA